MITMREQMKADLRSAMKARATENVTTLRSVLAAIDNAEAVPEDPSATAAAPVIGKRNDVPRKVLSADDIHQIVAHEVDERQRASHTYAELGQTAEAERLQRAATLLATYLAK